MSLEPGARLGPYEIVAALGAGGMGEVYRAKDTRLGRDVAVKLIPTHLSQNPEVRERFEREAKAISSLNHPNICTLYDVGREGDAEYFVMELLDGEPLAARLERGPMKLDEALRVASPIAEGLAAAHRQGIVHRDLKPANVVLTKAGPKILDFGVAKLREEQVVDMATRTTPLTSHGAMVGTVQYMSPEQLEGRPVDHRADLFAFGALLYEMITGQRAFAGQSQASVIAAILDKEPRPMSELAPATPAALDRVIKSCLAKDPDERWQSAGDLARELRWIAEGKVTAPEAARVAKPASRGRERLAWGVAAALFVVAAVMAFRGRPQAAAPTREPTTRFRIDPAGGQVEGAPVVSPDGRWILYVLSPESGNPALWLHSLETGEAKLLPGTEGARQPFWSPDVKALAFFAQGRLKKMTLGGEPPVVLCDAADPRGGSWGSGGDILFCPSAAAPTYRVSANGGSPAMATKLATGSGEQSHRMPWFLPDGRHFLVTVTGTSERSGVFWGSLDGKDLKRVLPDVTGAKFDARGAIVFRRGGTLMAQRFDPERGELTGDAVVLVGDVGTDSQFAAADQFSISRDGVLVFRTGASQKMRLSWIDRTGKPLGLLAPDHSLFEPAISPDGTRLAAGGTQGTGTDPAIFVIALQPGGQIQRLTFGKREPETANWSADGKFVYFTVSGTDGWSIMRKASDGTGSEEVLAETKRPIWVDSASVDGRHLVCEQYEPDTGSDLYLLALDGHHELTPFRKTPNNETHAAISPDGRYIAYVSDEQGTADVFVETVPASGSRWQISNGGGDQPAWRPDGKALYYMSTNRMLTEIDVKSASPFTLGAQRPLFRLAIPSVALTGPRTYYAVARNADRFVVNTLVGDRGRPGFDVVLNWDTGATAK